MTFSASMPTALAEPTVPLSRPTTVIVPTGGWLDLPFAEIWGHRELLLFLVWRDLKVRYKQSVLGVLWVVLQPVLTMLVFTVIFHLVLRVDTGGDAPYPVFVYSALLPWLFFSTALIRSSESLVSNAQLVSKIYFPRILIPIASVLGGLVDFGIGFVLLVGLMLLFGIQPGLSILSLPVAVLAVTATALGIGLWLSAFNVQYRDVRYIAPFLVQVWMYATPVFYPISLIPERWRLVYGINPLVHVVEAFRGAVLGEAFSAPVLGFSLAFGLILIVSGTIYFQRTEQIFADVI
jgi:lipopolysaccharide transport system permease protein